MKRRIPMKTGDEYDALTRAKNFHHWRSGARKSIKKAFNKKERKFLKKNLVDSTIEDLTTETDML